MTNKHSTEHLRAFGGGTYGAGDATSRNTKRGSKPLASSY